MQCGRKQLAGSTQDVGEMPSTVVEDKDETAYPSQAISIVVGYPPGGGADSLARLLAKHLGKELASEVVVVNHVGSDGNVGAEAMCRAKADGYTLYLCARPNTLHKYLFASLEFDFAEDLIPIGLIAMTPNVIVASRHSPVRSLEDLLEIARTNPGQLRCASPGMGSTGYLLLEIFQQETGIDVDHIPYKGSSLAYLDLKEGRVDVLFSTLSSAIPHIREGTLQGLAIMSKTMDGHIVELPSMADRGMPNLDVDSWTGLMVPSGTPESVIARLSEGINAVLKEEDVIAEMMQLGYATPPQPNPPEVMKKLGEEEAERWLTMMKDRGTLPFH